MTSGGNSAGTQRLSPWDYVKITVFGFALTALWNSLHSIILPVRILDLVRPEEKNTFLALLTGTGLILAMLVQPVAGAISDCSTSRWGRRRPYILIGALIALLLLPGIGLAESYITLFLIYCLLQISSNIAQAPYQAFIPDIVPAGKRGLASGVKGLVEIAGGMALVRAIGYLMGQYFTEPQSTSWLWAAVGILMLVLLGALLATLFTVREPACPGTQPFRWQALYQSFRIDRKRHPDFTPFLISRLLIITAFATLQRFAFFYLQDARGIANPSVATADLLIVIGVTMAAVAYPAGVFSDRVGRRPMVAAAGAVGAVGIIVLILSRRYGGVLMGGFFLGASSGIFLSTNWALATDLLSPGEEARYLGITNVATAGGSALAIFLMGPAIDFFNRYQPGQGYTVMLLACLVYFVAGGLLVMKVRHR